jgi:hypothetical protein
MTRKTPIAPMSNTIPKRIVIPRPEGRELPICHFDAVVGPLSLLVRRWAARSKKGKPAPTKKSANAIHPSRSEKATSSFGSNGNIWSGLVMYGGAARTAPRMDPTIAAAISPGPLIRFRFLGRYKYTNDSDSAASKPNPVPTFQFISLTEVYPTPK